MRKADNLTTILCHCFKSGNLNFLEPSGPLQACNGTALPFYLNVMMDLLKHELSFVVFNKIGKVRRAKHFWRVCVTMATVARLVILVTIGILVTLVTTVTRKVTVMVITTEKNFGGEGGNVSDQIN